MKGEKPSQRKSNNNIKIVLSLNGNWKIAKKSGSLTKRNVKIARNAKIFFEAWNCKKHSEGLENSKIQRKERKSRREPNHMLCYRGWMLLFILFLGIITVAFEQKVNDKNNGKENEEKFEGIFLWNGVIDWGLSALQIMRKTEERCGDKFRSFNGKKCWSCRKNEVTKTVKSWMIQGWKSMQQKNFKRIMQ